MDPREANLESLSPAELEAFQKINSENISDLKKEIAFLRWKLRQFGPGASQIQDLSRRQEQSDNGELIEELNSKICHYANRLKDTENLTKITIDAINRQVQFVDEEHCSKEFIMELTVCNRKVRLSCTLEEEFISSSSKSTVGKVTWFQIEFQEDIHTAIGKEIEKAAGKIALHSAFTLLKTYLQWKKERDEAVINLSETHPKTVSVFTSDDGTYSLCIKNPKPERPVFDVKWGQRIVDGRIVPSVNLNVTAPQKWCDLDNKGIFESAPEIFQSMIKNLNLLPALEALVQLVETDGQMPQMNNQPQTQD